LALKDKTNDVGNMTFGEGHEPGFDFGECSFELHHSSLSLDYDEAKVSSSYNGSGGNDGGSDDGGGGDDGYNSGDKNGKLLVDKSQHGCTTQVVLLLFLSTSFL
jgi:hypothetical protein